MDSNVETMDKMDFVRDFLCNVCNFNSDVCDALIAWFHKLDNNILGSVYLNGNDKYQVLVEFVEKGININSKVTTTYEYNDGTEWIMEEYVESRQDKFRVEVDLLHHLYEKKSTVSLMQEHSALREGMKELRGECFYLLSDDFSLEESKVSKLQKIKYKK